MDRPRPNQQLGVQPTQSRTAKPQAPTDSREVSVHCFTPRNLGAVVMRRYHGDSWLINRPQMHGLLVLMRVVKGRPSPPATHKATACWRHRAGPCPKATWDSRTGSGCSDARGVFGGGWLHGACSGCPGKDPHRNWPRRPTPPPAQPHPLRC